MTFQWIALKLTVFCIAVYLVSAVIPLDGFVLVASEVLQKPWTLVTSIFLHANLQHLFYNMFALALFGSILEKVIGHRKFLTIFFIGGIASGIVAIFFYSAVLGASGAIFVLLGTLAALRPWMMIWTYGMPMPMVLAIGVWAFIDLTGFIAPDNVAHAAHLGGLFIGIAIGLALRKKYRKRKEKRFSIDNETMERWESKYMRVS